MSACCCGPDYEGMRERWQAYQAQQSELGRAIRRAAFQSIQTGHPLPVAALADRIGIPGGSLDEILGKMENQGEITLTPSRDAITGAAGLSVAPSRHYLVLNGVQLHTWCALDAVGIPTALAADAFVESRCAASGRPLLLEFQQGRLVHATHPQALVWVVPPEDAWSLCADT